MGGSDVKKPKRKPAPPTKPKPTPPRNLTPELCDQLRHDLLTACRQVAQTYGLSAEGGDLSDIDLRHGFDIQFRVGIPMPDGSLFSHDKALFEVLAPNFGLEPSDFGRIFRTGGEAFRITAINPNRPKYPVSTERIADGRGFKFSAENVIAHLNAAEG